MGVIGCQLLDPAACVSAVFEQLREDGHMAFYDLRHQTVQEHLFAMFHARVNIDLITLQQRLKDAGVLDQVGGIAYLSQLQDAVPSAANLHFYLDILKEKHVLRRYITTASGIVGRIFDYEGEVDALADEVEREILGINAARQAGKQTVQAATHLVHPALERIEQHFASQGAITGMATGFTDLDAMLDGLHGGELIVIAARPSMGKTSLGLNIAEHVAVDNKIPVGVFSLEMDSTSLMVRMVCGRARVNVHSMRKGFLTENDFPKLTNAAGQLQPAPLYIDDTSGLSILQVRSRARQMVAQHGVKLFVVDYLQLLHSTSRKAQENRVQEIAEISGGLKAMAKELNVPVICLAQLNREIEKEKNRKPRMSDLRESGSIEQDADVIGLLYKPASDDDEPDNQEQADAGMPVNLVIAKQRNGPTGDVEFTFLKQYTRFAPRARMSDGDVPEHRNPHSND